MLRLASVYLVLWLTLLQGCGGSPGPDIHSLTQAFESAVVLSATPVLRIGEAEETGTRQISLGEGWAAREAETVWAIGDQSRVELSLPLVVDSVLFLSCKPYRRLPEDPLPSIEISVNGDKIATVPLSSDWQDAEIQLPAGALHAGRNSIILRHAYHHSPHELGRGEDSRSLAVSYRAIGLRPLPQLVATNPLTINRSAAGVSITIATPARVVVPIEFPLDSTTLKFVLSSSTSRRPQVDVALMALDGSFAKLGHPVSIGNTGLFELQFPIKSWAGSTAILSIDHRPERPDDRVVITSAHIEATPIAASGGQVERLPDIVMIIVDAARPDHMGTYGYLRDTTPQIDELARNSLVFSKAFADAPYTQCSVPTILTGLSFLRHGIVGPDQVIQASAMTLVDHLGEAGYETIGFSAMPNNSVARNLHHGYDEFVELWSTRPFEEAMRPHLLTKVAIDRLDEGFDKQPFFMMLHYLPPHEPLYPLPEFDLFRDPDYHGQLNPGLDMMAGNLKKIVLEPADVDRIVSLYDGNVRMVDDAIGQLIDALEARKRWQDTVVLIIADHGEAFFEHGSLGHNETVYDEMVRVPFILRSAGLDLSRGESDQLVSLADVTPTLLGLAGVNTAQLLDGVDLLSASSSSAPDRVIVMRSSQPMPTLAVRTSGWKAVFPPKGRPMLFDLTVDPGEIVDRSLEEPTMIASLEAVLRAQQRRAKKLGNLAQAGQQIDRELLRSLGYL